MENSVLSTYNCSYNSIACIEQSYSHPDHLINSITYDAGGTDLSTKKEWRPSTLTTSPIDTKICVVIHDYIIWWWGMILFWNCEKLGSLPEVAELMYGGPLLAPKDSLLTSF